MKAFWNHYHLDGNHVKMKTENYITSISIQVFRHGIIHVTKSIKEKSSKKGNDSLVSSLNASHLLWCLEPEYRSMDQQNRLISTVWRLFFSLTFCQCETLLSGTLNQTGKSTSPVSDYLSGRRDPLNGTTMDPRRSNPGRHEKLGEQIFFKKRRLWLMFRCELCA